MKGDEVNSKKKYLIGAQFNKSFTVCYFTDKLVSYCATFARNALAYPVCAPLSWVLFHPAKSRPEQPNVFVKVKRTSLFRKKHKLLPLKKIYIIGPGTLKMLWL